MQSALFKLLPLCLAAPLYGADVESQHGVNGALNLPAGWTLQLHSRVRTNHNSSDFCQVRGGPIVQKQLSNRWTLIGGYYLIGTENGRELLSASQRAFTGARLRAVDRRDWALDTRVLYERHFGADGPAFNRYRGQLMLTALRRAKFQPVIAGEFMRRPGFMSGRYNAGLQWLRGDGSTIAGGYELRQYQDGRNAHVLYTLFTFRLNHRQH